MSYVVSPFEVSSKVLAGTVKCRFVHLLAGIATRHSDTIDCVFQAGGRRVTVALSCPAIVALREREGHVLSDQQLAEIAALCLRRSLEKGVDPSESELFVGDAGLRQSAKELGFF